SCFPQIFFCKNLSTYKLDGCHFSKWHFGSPRSVAEADFDGAIHQIVPLLPRPFVDKILFLRHVCREETEQIG
ncbi:MULTISPECIES: hypothetical protein, partial [Bacteroidales]|uniref:hypothetical protein n=1 Tax=Bacteroidales TaxID=171549 RepID=UPI0035A0D03E